MTTTTCITAIKHDGEIYLAGDAAGSNAYSIQTRKDPKVFARMDHEGQPFLFGYTSSFRMGQLLRYKLRVPAYKGVGEDDALYQYMCTDFVDSVRQCFKENGYAWKSDGERGGTFIIAYRDRLFQIQNDYQVAEPDYDYTAVGCGDDLALGALHAMDGLVAPVSYEMAQADHQFIASARETVRAHMPPHLKLQLALEAAAEFSPGVRGPFYTVSTKCPDIQSLSA